MIAIVKYFPQLINFICQLLAKAILFRYSSHHRANPDPTIGVKNCKYLCE